MQYIGSNQRAEAPLDTSDYVYEYMVRTKFVQSPFMNMSGIPCIGMVPGLGVPATYYVSEFRAVEELDGFVFNGIVAAGLFGSSRSTFSQSPWHAGWPPPLKG